MESKPMELPQEWVEKIETSAKSFSGHQPDVDSTPFRNGLYSGYKSGAIAYAPWLYTCQQNYAALRAKCGGYERALRRIQSLEHNATDTMLALVEISEIVSEALEKKEVKNG